MTNDIRTWLQNKINIISEDYEYVDNVRFACKDSFEEMMDYDIQVKEGCCGFYDEEIVCPLDNKVYKIGFNYGH